MPTVTQQRTLAPHSAGWTGSITLDQTDPASGIESLALSLTGTLSSLVLIHSLERAASTLASTDIATVSLERPDGSVLLAAGPSTTVTAVLPAMAWWSDAATMLPATGSATVSTTYWPGQFASPDSALLIGTGTVTLPVVTTARVDATAPGNFVALFDSRVGASVSDTATTTGRPGDSSGAGSSETAIMLSNYGAVEVSGPTPVLITTPVQHIQIAPSTTGWSQALGVAGFDPAFGTLKTVNITLTANAAARLQAENLEPMGGALTVSQTATIALEAGGAVLDSASVTVTSGKTLSAFDGKIDDFGASGETAHGQAASAPTTMELSTADGLAAFTGPTAANVTVAGVGQTTINGPGALSIAAGLEAGTTIDVSYTYFPTAGSSSGASTGPARNLGAAASGVGASQHQAAASVDAMAGFGTTGLSHAAMLDAFFDADYYLSHNPDVAAARVDPLVHYETFGWKEGRDPGGAFDTNDYLAANPDVRAAGVDPLLHYIQYGQAEHRMAFLVPVTLDKLVDAVSVYTLHPEVAAAGLDAATWFDTIGWNQGANPGAFFDTSYYLSHNPDVAAAQVNPLLHYETYGWREGRDPSAGFSTGKYLAANADVTAAGVDPLLHYVAFGQAEHRAVFPA